MDDEEPWMGWGEQFLARYATGRHIEWSHSGAAYMGDRGWGYLTEARRNIADETAEGALIQALVEVGAIPYRERYEGRHYA